MNVLRFINKSEEQNIYSVSIVKNVSSDIVVHKNGSPCSGIIYNLLNAKFNNQPFVSDELYSADAISTIFCVNALRTGYNYYKDAMSYGLHQIKLLPDCHVHRQSTNVLSIQ
jgi:hypothetical protein